MFKKITTMLAATSLLALGATASAQQLTADGQIASPPTVAPQSAGGFGASTIWAFVEADGSHASGTGGSGLANSAKTSTGRYEVIFRRGIGSGCVFIGTMSRQSSGTSPGFIDVVKRSGNTKGVFVETRNTSGTLTDLPFAVLVSCAR